MSVDRFARKELNNLRSAGARARGGIIESSDTINLGAGDPDFNQPDFIIDAVSDAMKEGHTHYVFFGDPDLKKAIADYYRKYGVEVDPSQVFITSGGSLGIFQIFAAILSPGEEVLILDPAYQGYTNPIIYLGGKIKRAKMKKNEKGLFRPDIENIRKKITDYTKAVIICNPDNPAGIVYTDDEITAIAELAVEKDLIIISDEVYPEYIWSERKHIPIINKPGMAERNFILGSFSKIFAWTGCRTGYIIAGPELSGLLNKVPTGNLETPVPFQKAGVVALEQGWAFVEEMRQEYKKRIEYSVKRLNEMPGIKCVQPEATFYLFPDISELGISSQKFVEGLYKEEKIRIFPGSNYGPNSEGHVRLSLVKPVDVLTEVFDRIERYVKKIQ